MIRVASKLLKCQANMTYSVKDYTPFDCKCDGCNSYFLKNGVFSLKRYLVIEPIFCVKVHFNWKKSIATGKGPFQLEKVHFSSTKSISTGKSPCRMKKVDLKWNFSMKQFL